MENKDEINNHEQRIFMLNIYRVMTLSLATLMLGIISWMALNVAHIPVIETKIEGMVQDMNHTSQYQSDKLNDHEIRIRTLEMQKK